MVTDGQVRKLHRELDSGTSLASAAWRTGTDAKTARHYRDNRTLPGTRRADRRRTPRTSRTRIDPLAEVGPAVEKRVAAEPRRLARTPFDRLRREHPGRFLESHRRAFERRVRQWRAPHGPGKAIMFRQGHAAGRVGRHGHERAGRPDRRPTARSPGVPLRADLFEPGARDAVPHGLRSVPRRRRRTPRRPRVFEGRASRGAHQRGGRRRCRARAVGQ
jgi:hypothetical protein